MPITLITDFGFSDHYVGVMKGVILSINPDVQVVDISHGVDSQDVDQAAYILNQSYSFYPTGTIHVVVVDPGVGSNRAILVVKTEDYFFLAPDNGVLKYIFNTHPRCQVYRVTNTQYFLKDVSRSFHGRDIFAPVAAHLSRGVTLDEIGELFHEFKVGEIKTPQVGGYRITGEIIFIDRFGNGITNIDAMMIQQQGCKSIQVKEHRIDTLNETYSDKDRGSLLALIGSSGTLEISVNQGSAQQTLNLKVGDPVIVNFD